MRICIIIPPAPGLFDQRTNVPLGPLYVAAILEKEGHRVKLISLLGRAVPTSWPRADLYAMGFTTPQADAAIAILKLIRSQYPDAKVLAAGAHAEFCAVETLQAGFDAVVVGEADLTILQVAQQLPNLVRIYYGTPPGDLNKIPLPARHLLPEGDLYNEAAPVFLGQAKGHVASIMASRGCPYHCAFCGNSPLSDHFRYRSAANIVSEMKQLVELGVTYFKFQDDSFTIVPQNVWDLGQAVYEEFGLGTVHTRMHTRADMFSPRIVQPLKMMGLDVAAFGIESGSPSVLIINRKKVSVEQSELALRIAHDAGFTTLGFFMFGLPGENEHTICETIEFIRRNRDYIDRANMGVFVPYPGCDIALNPRKYRMHILERDWNKYWVTQKREILALPYGMSYDGMMKLMDTTFSAFAEFGYTKPEWEEDFAKDDEMVGL